MKMVRVKIEISNDQAEDVKKRFERARREFAASIPRSPELAEMSEANRADAAVERQVKL